MAGIDSYTKLMLHNNLSGGKTFTDSSSSAHNVTGEGDAVLSTVQKKFGNTGLVLDGTNDDLVVPSSTDFDFGTGNFTLDCWCRRTTTDSGSDTIFSRYLSSNNQLFLDVNLGKFRFFFQNAGLGVTITGTTTLAIDTWYHVAVVRTGSTWKLFVNGAQEGGDQTSTESVNNLTGQDFYIGGWGGGSLYKFEGYLDEVRISDSARWTADFTVPSAEYSSDVNTKLLLHLNADPTVFVDSSDSAHTITANGDAIIDSSQYKFGGASGAFDGVGDYVSAPDSDDWAFGANDFTVDLWVRITSRTANVGFWSQVVDSNNRINLLLNTSNYLIFNAFSGGSTQAYYYCTWNPTLDTWYHLAIVRDSTIIKMFIDGVLQSATESTAIGSTTLANLAAPFCVGRAHDGTDYRYLDGYVDEVRVSNGIARWTSSFTPPTEEYTSLSFVLPFIHSRNVSPINKVPSDVLVW